MSAPSNRVPKPKPEPLFPVNDGPSVFATSDPSSPNKSAAPAPPPAAAGSGGPNGQSTQAANSNQNPGNGAPVGSPNHPQPPPQPVHWDPNDTSRGWDPLEHGRLKFSLHRHFKDDEDQVRARSAFSNALPEDLTSAAAHEREVEDAQTPTNDALVNVCDLEEPRVELELQTSVINAINSAYSSSGYPSVMTAGNARGGVYGSFVDLRNPSTHTLNLPPKETIIVAPSTAHAGEAAHMETLMKVLWHRSAGLLVPPPDLKAGDGRKGGTPINPAAAAAVGLPRPTSLQQHIQQFPEGVHGKQSSPLLHHLILRGEYPTTKEEAAAFPPVAPTAAGGSANAASSPTSAAANVPPPGKQPSGTAPVLHTLVSANTFNHLSVHFVAHQDGKFLYSAPVQTLSASIATRKVTAHQLFMLGREEVDPIEDVEGYELLFASAGSSSVPSPQTPAGLANSGRRPSYTGTAGAGGAPSPDCVDGRRQKLSFRQLSVPEEAKSVFFDPNGATFAGADARKRTIHAALVGFRVEPLLLFGNQNGDIFIHSILEEKIVQRLNFNGGLSTLNGNALTGAGGGGSGGGKFISSPVSTIVEVENGLEKKLSSMVQNAMLAKHNGRDSIPVDERVKYPTTSTGAVNKTAGYFPLSPSLFAVGFDCGQVLLICVTSEGGWMLKHFNNTCFGYRPIQSIAPRVPSFFVRLWASYAAAPTTSSAANSATTSPKLRASENPSAASSATAPIAIGKKRTGSPMISSAGTVPTNTLICTAATLFVPDEEQHVAAISCSGGCIVLVRLPGLEVLSSISVYDYSAVGEILTLAWSATSALTLVTPDILLASGEDDTMTAFHLVSTAVIPRGASGAFFSVANAYGTGFAAADTQTNNSTLSSNSSFHINSGLRILERKRFHKSWVNNVSVLPLVLPVSRAGPGMPQFLGTCLLATSYDNRTSFWPILFNRGNGGTYEQELGLGKELLDDSKYVLIDGPTAAYPLHNELVVGTAVGGGGTSYFVATVCCRGRLRLWSCAVKTE